MLQSVFEATGYIVDPHGAVAYLALDRYIQQHPTTSGFFLETAHPIKFPAAVEQGICKPLEMPEQVKQLMHKEKAAVKMQPDAAAFKKYILDRFSH